jgi:hypothetical protein
VTVPRPYSLLLPFFSSPDGEKKEGKREDIKTDQKKGRHYYLCP